MKLNIVSDLHLELLPTVFIENVTNALLEVDADTLVLAGDICSYYKHNIYTRFLNKMAQKYDNVLLVPGNHEYYGSDINAKLNTNNLQENVFILNNTMILIDGVTFLGTTLWTDFNKNNPLDMWMFRNMNDSRLIKDDDVRLTADKIVDLFGESYEFLDACLEAVSEFKDPTVVITHHAPSTQSIADKFKNDNMNYSFVSDLDKFILKYQPNLWIHGHTHTSFDYNIGSTRIIANPKGYYAENPEFKYNFVVEV